MGQQGRSSRGVGGARRGVGGGVQAHPLELDPARTSHPPVPQPRNPQRGCRRATF